MSVLSRWTIGSLIAIICTFALYEKIKAVQKSNISYRRLETLYSREPNTVVFLVFEDGAHKDSLKQFTPVPYIDSAAYLYVKEGEKIAFYNEDYIVTKVQWRSYSTFELYAKEIHLKTL